MRNSLLLLLALLAILLNSCEAPGAARVMQWHKLTLSFTGPELSESEPATFRDHRLNVTFTGPSGQQYVVPGFFAADGNAGETSAETGTVWQVRFCPDEVGEWAWEASFRVGEGVAVRREADAGNPAQFDGEQGNFQVLASDKSGRDFRAQGMLRNTGQRYLQYAGSDKFFIKGGAGSPENFLAFEDFDGTYDAGGTHFPALGENQLHAYGPHVGDWKEGDPVWQSGKGKGIIGSLNYLSGQGINAAYILLMNVQGDGQDLWPWTDPDPENLETYDVSKLDQWETVFTHMDRVGVLADFLFTETENENLFEAESGVAFGHRRKMYYREMIARFGHHLGIVWNLGEENGKEDNEPWGSANSTEQRKQFARYIQDLDPYDHPIVVHNWPNDEEKIFSPLLGDEAFSGLSIQRHEAYNAEVQDWIERSAEAGHPWIVAIDEPLGWEYGCVPDAEDPDHDIPRQEVLWGTLMAGGFGVDWYFGWQNNAPTSDLSNEDWRSRENMWIQTRYALDFFHEHLPFERMMAQNELTPDTTDYVFALPNDAYVVYLKNGNGSQLDLSGAEGEFDVRWFDPRRGGELQMGDVKMVAGGKAVELGLPPAAIEQDWVVLLEKGAD